MAITNILTKPAVVAAAVPTKNATRWAWLREAAREPFLHFILLGAAIFAASETVEHYTTQYRVVIPPERITQLAETYEQQFGTAPTQVQLKTLVDNYIKEEIEYRESTALGLDRDDEIVRRRLVQKYEFLQQDLQSLDDPSQETLKAFYTAHAADYGEPAKRTFTHVYFSPDVAGDDDAHRRAEAELKRLNASGAARAPSDGDTFPGPSDVADLNAADAQRLFGSSDLSRDIFTVPEGQWAGPFRSGFGWHLIRVTAETPATSRPYDAVAPQVLEDWKAAQRGGLNAKTYAALRAKYNVVVQGGAK